MTAAANEDIVGSVGAFDSAATTSLAIPVARSTPPQAPGPRDRSTRNEARNLIWIAVIAALAIGVGSLVLASLHGTGGAGGSPSSSGGPTASLSATASAGRSPTAKPTADGFARAQARLSDLRAAIADASGGHGIKGREANEIQALLLQEQHSLDSRDASGARATADQLVQGINNIKDEQIDEEQAQALKDAARALQNAVAGL